MRDDLNASEQRLIAALDRIDRYLDSSAVFVQAVPDLQADADIAGLRAQLDAVMQENQRLSGELSLMHERQADALAAVTARLAQANDRLQHAGQEAARLVAANEALSAANRALIVGSADGSDEARLALEAEVESLRAARAAEIAQMGDVIDALDRMIGTPAPEGASGTAPAGLAGTAAAAAIAQARPVATAVLEMPMPEQIADIKGAEADADEAVAETSEDHNEQKD